MKGKFSTKSSRKNIEIMKDALERAPIFDVKGYPYVMFPLNFDIDPEVLKAAANEIIKICDFKEIDEIVTMEAKGIAISTAVSMMTGVPVVIARRRKLGTKDEIEISKKTAYGESSLYLSGVSKGDKTVILDDVISTGGSMIALVKALRKIGVEIEEIAVIYNREDHRGEQKLKEKTGIKAKSLITIKEVTYDHLIWETSTQLRG